MQRIIAVFMGFSLLCYPFAIYFGVLHLSPRYLAALVFMVFLLRFFLIRKELPQRNQWPNFILTIVGLCICSIVFIFNSPSLMRFYPVMVNLLLLGFFSHSVFYPPTVIERFARINNKVLTNQVILYTKNLTLVWCAFFIVNGLIAFCTACFGSWKTWLFYNGFLSYVFIGVIFFGELIVRKFFIKKNIENFNE